MDFNSLDAGGLAAMVAACAAVAAAVFAWVSNRMTRRSNRISQRFQDAHWVVESRPCVGWHEAKEKDPRWEGVATFGLRNKGPSPAKDVRLVVPFDPTGLLIPEKTWPLIPPDGVGDFPTHVTESAWLGTVMDQPERRIVRVEWSSAGEEARSVVVQLPEGHDLTAYLAARREQNR